MRAYNRKNTKGYSIGAFSPGDFIVYYDEVDGLSYYLIHTDMEMKKKGNDLFYYNKFTGRIVPTEVINLLTWTTTKEVYQGK